MFNEYQEKALTTALPVVKEMGLSYSLRGLAGETGEILNNLWFTETTTENMALEIGDVFWYCAVSSRWLDRDFEDIVRVPELIFDVFDTNTVLQMLAVSVCQLMEISKKIDRDGLTDAKKKTIIDIIGDITYDLLYLCEKFKLAPQKVLNANITKLTSRKERNKIHGSGDYR